MEKYERSFKKLMTGLKILATKADPQYTFISNSQEECICRIEDIEANKFSQISKISIEDVISKFNKHSFLPEAEMGKKSHQIVFSENKELLLKVIIRPDLNKIIKILDSYIQHIGVYPQSTMVKLYRIFVVQTKIQHYVYEQIFLLMESIRPSRPAHIYDLKGYLVGRITEPQVPMYGKDQNFVVSKQRQILKNSLKLQQLRQLMQKLRVDFQFLCSHEIMDYSLLLVFIEEQQSMTKKYQGRIHRMSDGRVCIYGTIDYLQEFNSYKKMENRIKGIFKLNKDISAIDPKSYSKRLLEYLEQLFLPNQLI